MTLWRRTLLTHRKGWAVGILYPQEAIAVVGGRIFAHPEEMLAVVGSGHCSPTRSDGSGWRLNLLNLEGMTVVGSGY